MSFGRYVVVVSGFILFLGDGFVWGIVEAVVGGRVVLCRSCFGIVAAFWGGLGFWVVGFLLGSSVNFFGYLGEVM